MGTSLRLSTVVHFGLNRSGADFKQTVRKLDATLSTARGEQIFAIFSALGDYRPRKFGTV
jgi:hypothetical protein